MGARCFLRIFAKNSLRNFLQNDPLLEEVETALNSTGVLCGEFGLVEAYKNKRTAIEPWTSHSNEKSASVRAHLYPQLGPIHCR